jgi:hypothetical protein
MIVYISTQYLSQQQGQQGLGTPRRGLNGLIRIAKEKPKFRPIVTITDGLIPN